MTRKVLAMLAVASAAVLVLAGCAAFPFAVGGSGKPLKPAYANGQVVDVTGRVVVDKNQVSLADQASQAVFRFVGLQPAPKKALGDLNGKVTRVRLRIVGSGNGNVYNAQFVQFSGRP